MPDELESDEQGHNYDPYRAIHRRLTNLKPFSESLITYLGLVPEFAQRDYARMNDFFGMESSAQQQDRLLLESIEHEVFTETFQSDIEEAKALYLQRGSLLEILSLVK